MSFAPYGQTVALSFPARGHIQAGSLLQVTGPEIVARPALSEASNSQARGQKVISPQ